MIKNLLRLIEFLRGTDSRGRSSRIADPATSSEFEAALMSELNDLQVYVVDDDSAVRISMAMLLQSWGCTPHISASGEEMIAMLERGGPVPDAIISDYRLPGGSTGVEILNLIHSQYSKEIPALLITGDYEIDRLSEANAGEYTLLFKPVEPARLRAWLRNTTKSTKRGGGNKHYSLRPLFLVE